MSAIRNILAGIALSAAAAQASAVPVTVNVVGADFNNPVGGSSLNFYNTDGIAGNEEIRWGTPHAGDQSGYRFDASAPPAFTVETDTQFSLLVLIKEGSFFSCSIPMDACRSVALRLYPKWE